ncbi:hypothetical protein PGB90_007316 [Kerria lacca]
MNLKSDLGRMVKIRKTRAIKLSTNEIKITMVIGKGVQVKEVKKFKYFTTGNVSLILGAGLH